MNLVPEARYWWRMHSTYIFAIFAIFPAVWLASPDLQALLPPRAVSAIAPVVAVIGYFLRIRDQFRKIDRKPTVPADKPTPNAEGNPS